RTRGRTRRRENRCNVTVYRKLRFQRECPGKLRPRVLHHGVPERSIGIARVNQPRAVASEDVERRKKDVAQHLLEVLGSLHGAVDAVHALQELEIAPVLRLRALALGDVAANTAVAHEAPDLIERRDAGNGDVARASVRSRAGELEIPEWEVCVERGPVLAPSLFIGLDVRDLPAGLADLGAACRRVGQPFGKLLPREAMLGVGLPVHIEGELHQGAEALLARAERLPGAPTSRAELGEEQAETNEDE